MTSFTLLPRALLALEAISERTYAYAKAIGKVLEDDSPAIANAALGLSDVAFVVFVTMLVVRHDVPRIAIILRWLWHASCGIYRKLRNKLRGR